MKRFIHRESGVGRFHIGSMLVFVTAAILSVTLLSMSPAKGEDSPLKRFEFVQIRMGVPVRMTVYASESSLAIQATDAAYARIKDLDRSLSDYNPESELNHLCQHPHGEPVAVSDDLWKMLELSQFYSCKSDGAFDATIGPVIKLWRVARRKKALPDPERLKNAMNSVGYQFVKLDPSRKTATLLKPGMQLDFGGIAKGYAADEAFKVLLEHGLSTSLVAVAGEIRAGDPPPGRSGWKVEIEDRGRNPPPDHRPLVLILRQQAVSTSGDTYQFLELDGVRYSHIVDPKIGIGLTTPGSVTIISTNCTQTDALATVVSVLGPEKGFEVLKQFPETVGLFVQLNPQGTPVVTPSPGWAEFVQSLPDE
ncbi:MAG TPA: FAD:protein FMN transferase [Planctomicrobium sp.]|nr:FAD:protein FMN transferase [Planctomicrobium sp.]